jgi:hypothetical protein
VGKLDQNIIYGIVNAQIEAIDLRISQSHINGQSSVFYSLPDSFPIGQLDRIDAQTIIYSELITAYRDHKGYSDVKITLGDKPTLFVKWITGINETERRERLQIIESVRVKK